MIKSFSYRPWIYFSRNLSDAGTVSSTSESNTQAIPKLSVPKRIERSSIDILEVCYFNFINFFNISNNILHFNPFKTRGTFKFALFI